jgi:hypothetical protein
MRRCKDLRVEMRWSTWYTGRLNSTRIFHLRIVREGLVELVDQRMDWPEDLERGRFLQGEAEKRIQELATTSAIYVRTVRVLPLEADAERVHGQVPQVLRIVVWAGGEGIEAAGEPIDGRVKVGLIIVGENDVKLAVEERRGELVEVARNESQTDEVSLVTLLQIRPGQCMRVYQTVG